MSKYTDGVRDTLAVIKEAQKLSRMTMDRFTGATPLDDLVRSTWAAQSKFYDEAIEHIEFILITEVKS